jgi:hypothetical protein
MQTKEADVFFIFPEGVYAPFFYILHNIDMLVQGLAPFYHHN